MSKVYSLLQNFEANTVDSYTKNQKEWDKNLADLKENCEKELMRRQEEVRALNEILADWINKYLEIAE